MRSRFPQYLTQPFTVADLYQTVLPYRLHRRELGLETNEDYEITLTELLSGAREYLIVDEAMRDALHAELATSNPDPTAFKQFATASVALSPTALRGLEAGPAEAATPLRPTLVPPPAARSAPRVSNATPAAPRPMARTPSAPRAVTPQNGERCTSCNAELPAGRPITFCPHCGHDLTTLNCQACGSELEVGWKFCPTCGRPVGGTPPR
ncbi:MAG TPA: zinc-ribbon domain-containing protein [Gemmatimonadaceae bacterium]|nr:zinc-ribbon domain-containing protein [Gemmatimonadaceae bacterium]